MRRGRARTIPGIACLLAGAGAHVIACSSNRGVTSGGGADDATADGPPEAQAALDAGGSRPSSHFDAGDARAEATESFPTYVRIANWSPDAPPSGLDLCLAPHGTNAFQGPVFAQHAASFDAGAVDAARDAGPTDGGPPILAFPRVTAYLAIDPGDYDVRVVTAVAPASASCAAGVGADATHLAALPSFAYTTFAIVGDMAPVGSDPGLAVEELYDDQNVAGSAALRFVDMSPGLPAADLGRGALATSDFSSLFSGIAFGQTGSQSQTDAGTVDQNGYLYVRPFVRGTLSVHASTGATTDTTIAAGASVGSGSAVTFALVNGKTGGPPAQLLQCLDNEPVADLMAVCAVVSP